MAERKCSNCDTPLSPGAKGLFLPCSCGWVASTENSSLSKRVLIAFLISVIALTVLLINFRQLIPDNAMANGHLAKAKDSMINGDNEEAIKDLKVAIGLSPNRSELHHELSLAFFANNQPHQGLEEAERAAKLAPDDYKTQEVYAELLISHGAEAKALKQFDYVVEKFPKELIGRQQAALAYESAGKDDKAIAQWNEAIKLDPTYPTAWTRLAKLTFRSKGLGAAEVVITDGVKNIPDSPKLHFWKGLILSEQNKPDMAVKSFATAAKLDSDYSQLVAPYLDNFANSHGANLSVVPCIVSRTGIYITAVLNKELRAKLLVDSGATICVINRALSHKLGLNLLDGKRVKFESATGIDEGIEIELDCVSVGSSSAQKVKCIVYDGMGSDADGILGMSFLSRFKFTVDADVRQLILVRK
ncbi:tetratricopeptide repeat protein [bacterium]|nr:tetratricopeptide repeat protein [bacterium]